MGTIKAQVLSNIRSLGARTVAPYGYDGPEQITIVPISEETMPRQIQLRMLDEAKVVIIF